MTLFTGALMLGVLLLGTFIAAELIASMRSVSREEAWPDTHLPDMPVFSISEPRGPELQHLGHDRHAVAAMMAVALGEPHKQR
jgi:hypothetical protein